ncbi:MAG: hypothetical protein WKF47_18140 [Geodermatophilaceae bacterium]
MRDEVVFVVEYDADGDNGVLADTANPVEVRGRQELVRQAKPSARLHYGTVRLPIVVFHWSWRVTAV